jgi:hypothetical protein
MRTTITLAPDVAAEVERLRRTEGLGPSEAVNRLVRQGLSRRDRAARPYVHRTAPLGLRIDVGDVLDMLDQDPAS